MVICILLDPASIVSRKIVQDGVNLKSKLLKLHKITEKILNTESYIDYLSTCLRSKFTSNGFKIRVQNCFVDDANRDLHWRRILDNTSVRLQEQTTAFPRSKLKSLKSITRAFWKEYERFHSGTFGTLREKLVTHTRKIKITLVFKKNRKLQKLSQKS